MNVLWEKAKDELRGKLSDNSFSLWIQPLKIMDCTKDRVSVGCPNKFSANWITENYSDMIRESIRKVFGRSMDIDFTTYKPRNVHSVDPESPEIRQLPFPETVKYTNRGYGSTRLYFNRNFVFERFVVGPSNEFAYSASNAFAQSSTWNYQALLMLADAGLGKTHLSQAVGHSILKQNPDSKVYYITAEDFTNEMVLSLRNNRIEDFKNKYRRMCDVLLLEEIQFLSGKEKTQIELGYTLDALINDKKKVIFTSSLPPKDIPRMSRQLVSRLSSALVATIDNPDYMTRCQIIERKSREQDMSLSDEIISFLASCLKRDVRQIESVLNCLKAKSDLLNMDIDMSLAREVVSSFISDKPAVTLNHILDLVSRYFKVEPELLKSKSRKKIHVYPRNIFIYLSRRHTDSTLEKIGQTLNRSHSAIIYATDLIERKIKTDPKVRREVDFLDQKIEEMRQ